MVAADRPEFLWVALRIVQVVLRASPSAFDCRSSVRNPELTSASLSSLILLKCRAFIFADLPQRSTRRASDKREGRLEPPVCPQPIRLIAISAATTLDGTGDPTAVPPFSDRDDFAARAASRADAYAFTSPIDPNVELLRVRRRSADERRH